MNWAQPLWLLALPVVGVLAAVAVVAGWIHRRRLRAAFGAALFERVLPRSVRLRRGLRDAMGLVGLGLVVVALAEPRFDKEIRMVKASGVDLVLVLDLSRSMGARDVEPSRLERARREIDDLFRVLGADRVGLVVFAGNAWPLLPLTEDLLAIQSFVRDLDTDTFEAQGSALGAAIQAGLQVLEGSEGTAGKALLILSDGEIHEGDDALAQADAAAEAGVRIYAMGIGERPAPIPIPGGTLTYGGEEVLSTPDPATLQELARRTGGAYVKSVASNADVVGLYEGEMRRRLTVAERDVAQREVWRSAFQWPLGLGLGLILLGAWTGDGRRALASLAGGLLLLGALTGAGPARASTLAEADQLYRQGEYQAAADRLTELSLQRPEDPAVFDRLGAARYRAGDFEGSARAWDTAARLSGGADLDALYNAGNAHWRAGRLEEASEHFAEVLAAQPTHERAARNAEILAKELEARRNPPPPPPPKPDQGEDEGEGGEGEDEPPPSAGEEPQEGSDQAPSDQDPDPSEGEQGDEGEPGDPGAEDPQPPDPSQQPSDPGAGEPGGNQDDPDAPPAAGPSEGYGEEQEITAGQAERMLDSIEEGQRRIRVRGTPGGKPW